MWKRERCQEPGRGIKDKGGTGTGKDGRAADVVDVVGKLSGCKREKRECRGVIVV